MKLLSFGEIIWDVYSDTRTLGGAPLNFAAHAAIMGADAYIMSAVGDDVLGKEAIDQSQKIGVKTDYVSVLSQLPTGRCDVSTDARGVPSYIIAENTAYDSIEYCDVGAEFDVLAFGTLAMRCEHNRDVIKKLISDNDFTHIYADLNIRAPFYSKDSILLCLESADIVKISAEELPIVTESVFSRHMTAEEGISALCNRFKNIKILVLTDGERGAYCHSVAESKTYFAIAQKVDVVSTVGAGDSFGAAFLTCLMRGADLEECLKIASAVSGFVVSRKDAVPPDMAEFVKKIKK